MKIKKRSEENLPGEKHNVAHGNVKRQRQSVPQIAMQDLIGEKLRAHYDAVAREPVPERFEKLLMELDARTKSKK
jgi:hypothetical protein